VARVAATTNGLGTDGTRSPEVRHHRIAGPVGGLPTTSRPGESSRWEKLVDALSVRLTDAGSIPAASMFVQEGEPWVPPLSISPTTWATREPSSSGQLTPGCGGLGTNSQRLWPWQTHSLCSGVGHHGVG